MEDKSCRHLIASTPDAWTSKDCDFAIMTVKKNNKKKWLVSPHNGADEYATFIGDWMSTALDYNLYKLQPCMGFMNRAKEGFNCSAPKGGSFDVTDAIHVSWTYPGKPDFGLNDPTLVKIYDEGQHILW